MSGLQSTGNTHACCRRSFLQGVGGCAAYVMWSLAGAPLSMRRAWAEGATEPVVEEDFARVEQVAENAWAVISTPDGGMQTLSNGGIIAGDDAVLAIEGFMTPNGGAWLRGVAEELTGRAPTHVALTHIHRDHIAGVSGVLGENGAGAIAATGIVRDALPATLTGEGSATEVMVLDQSEPTEFDLGGRKVKFTPRLGHTDSDLVIELADPKVVWCGDLLWNGMFPNYTNAKPSTLSEHCRAMLSDNGGVYVPGHGPIGDKQSNERYLELLDFVEDAARQAHAAGKPAEDAAKEFSIPASLGEWRLFQPAFFANAFEAWARELGA
jgi:glyoxylase-like metal-dependent hydrolase (beta-lactamase superfamily II)